MVVLTRTSYRKNSLFNKIEAEGAPVKMLGKSQKISDKREMVTGVKMFVNTALSLSNENTLLIFIRFTLTRAFKSIN